MSASPRNRLQEVYARAGRKQVPISVLLEVNHLCHLDCVQCYLDDNHDATTARRQMGLAEIQHLIDEIAAAGCLFLTLTGGEIFLRKDVLEIARHARARHLAVRLFTSGTLLTPAIVEELVAIHPASVEITLYSVDPAVHEQVTRVRGSHAKTLEGIHRCARAGLPLTIKTPLMRLNLAGYRDVRALAESLGASFLCDPTITPRHDGDLSTTASRLSPAELVEVYADRALDGAIITCGNEPPNPGGHVCAIGERSCVISPFGEVFPCMEVHELAGNVLEQPFARIWEQSPVFERLRRLTYRDLPVCGGCTKAAYCNRCNGIALAEDGDFTGPSLWACTNAAAKEMASGVHPDAGQVAFVPLVLLASRPFGAGRGGGVAVGGVKGEKES